MKVLGVLWKVWLLVSLLAALAIGAALWDGVDGLTISYGDEMLDGASAAALVAVSGAALVFGLGLALSLVVALIGILVPATLVLAFACLVLGLGAAGVAITGAILLGLSPVLLIAGGFVLVVRALRRRRDAQASLA